MSRTPTVQACHGPGPWCPLPITLIGAGPPGSLLSQGKASAVVLYVLGWARPGWTSQGDCRPRPTHPGACSRRAGCGKRRQEIKKRWSTAHGHFPSRPSGRTWESARKSEIQIEFRNSTHVWVGGWSSLENRSLLGKPSV